jgi:hypothetical protein
MHYHARATRPWHLATTFNLLQSRYTVANGHPLGFFSTLLHPDSGHVLNQIEPIDLHDLHPLFA